MNCHQTPNSFMPIQLRIILWPTLYKRVVTFIRLKSWLHTVLKCTLYNSANGCVETYTVKQTRADCITFITYLVFSFADFSCFVNTKTVTVFLTSSRTTWTKESWVLQRNNQWWKQTLLHFLQKWVKTDFYRTFNSFLRVFPFIKFQALLWEKNILMDSTHNIRPDARTTIQCAQDVINSL